MQNRTLWAALVAIILVLPCFILVSVLEFVFRLMTIDWYYSKFYQDHKILFDNIRQLFMGIAVGTLVMYLTRLIFRNFNVMAVRASVVLPWILYLLVMSRGAALGLGAGLVVGVFLIRMKQTPLGQVSAS